MDAEPQRPRQYPSIMAALEQRESPRSSVRRPRLMFGVRPPSQTMSNSSHDNKSVSPTKSEAKQRYGAVGQHNHNGPGPPPSDTLGPSRLHSPKVEALKTAMQLQRSPSSPARPSSNGKKIRHIRNISSPTTRVDSIRTWNDDIPSWPATLANDMPPVPKIDSELFSPLPPHISRAAAKRLGITIQTPKAPGGAPLEALNAWAESKDKRSNSADTDLIPPLEGNTFYSSDSSDDESETKDRSSYSSGSSQTSYNVPTPGDAHMSPKPESTKELEALPQLTPAADSLETIEPVSAKTSASSDSKPAVTVVEISHPALEPALPIRAKSPVRSTFKPLPAEPETRPSSDEEHPVRRAVELPRENKPEDFQTVLNDIAENIRGRLKEAALNGVDAQITPAVPERSRKRLLKKALSIHTSTSPATSIPPTPRSAHPMERQRSNTSQSTVRVSTETPINFGPRAVAKSQPKEQQQEDGEFISANAAELVIVHIFYNFTDLRDLFAAARINRGFYSVFKRNELLLMKHTVRNHSPAAWELREASKLPLCARSNFRAGVAQEYTSMRYLQAYKRDTYILGALKSLILARCQPRLRADTINALRDREFAGSQRVDDALWRIWTFCTIFGSGNGREDDLIDQMDWLRGGSFAHFSSSVADALSKTMSSSFGRGNAGGLSSDELRDMLEIWGCIKSLLQGIISGTGRAEQARKHGVFESLRADLGGPAAADRLLEEWYHYLCTLGLSAALDLAAPSTSRTARVFNTARDMGWTKWSAPVNGGSRAGFLRTAIERVLEERSRPLMSPRSVPARQTQPQPLPQPQPQRQLTASSAVLAPVPESPSEGAKQFVFAPNDKTATPAAPGPSVLEDQSMSQWIKYIAGLETTPPAPLPAAHIAAQLTASTSAAAAPAQRSASDPTPLTAADDDLQGSRPIRPHAMRFTSSMLRFPWQGVMQPTAVTPAAAVAAGILAMPFPPPQPMQAPTVAPAREPTPLPLSRFNSVTGHGRGIDMDSASRAWSLRTKASAPVLS